MYYKTSEPRCAVATVDTVGDPIKVIGPIDEHSFQANVDRISCHCTIFTGLVGSKFKCRAKAVVNDATRFPFGHRFD